MAKQNYDEFIDKFKPKLTTDDCYTPEPVFNAVRDWVNNNLCTLDGHRVVRPFYPGGDYENFEYKPGDIVINNPPFSIFTKIVSFFDEKKIPFFLFAPQLTCFSCIMMATCIITNESITYDNGAKINTSFVSSMYKENYAFTTEPTLKEAIKATNAIKDKKIKKN